MSASRATTLARLFTIALNLLAATWAEAATDQGAPSSVASQNRTSKEEAMTRRVELEFIAQALSDTGKRTLKHKLAALPLYRVELELDPATHFLRGKIQILVPKNATPQGANSGVFLRTKAGERPGADLVFGNVTVDKRMVEIQKVSPGVHFVPFVPPQDAHPQTTGAVKPLRGSPFKEVFLSFSLKLIPRSWTAESELDNAALWEMFFGSSDETQKDEPKGTAKETTGAVESSDSEDSMAAPNRRDSDAFLLAGVFPQIALPNAQGIVPTNDPTIGESLWSPLIANYIVALVTPKDHVEAGTGLRIGMVPEANGKIRTTRVAAATREFSLIVGRNFFESTRKRNGILIREIHHFGYDMEAAGISHAVANSLDHFSQTLMPYPWSSFDIALTELDGGQPRDVFPTAIFWSPGINTDDFAKAFQTLLPGGMGILSPQKAREEEVAHLVAHQWFKGILSSDGLNDPAMDEALALQAACALMDATRGKQAGQHCRERHIAGGYRRYRMQGGRDFPLNTSLDSFERSSQFDAIAGSKGAFLLEQLRTSAGPLTYQSALRNFLKRKAFSDSSFMEIAQAISSASIPKNRQAKHRAMLRRFLTQTTGDKDIGAPFTAQDFAQQNLGSPALNDIIVDAAKLLFSREKNINSSMNDRVKNKGSPPKKSPARSAKPKQLQDN